MACAGRSSPRTPTGPEQRGVGDGMPPSAALQFIAASAPDLAIRALTRKLPDFLDSIGGTPYGEYLMKLLPSGGITAKISGSRCCSQCAPDPRTEQIDDAFSLVLGADDEDHGDHGDNGATSERPGFKVKIVPHPRTNERAAGKVGIDKQVRVEGVAGPWIRQIVTIRVRGWSAECKEPEYKCDAEIEEAIRVVGKDGQPISNKETSDPVIGSTSPQGGALLTGGKAAVGARTEGSQLATDKGDSLDHHRFIVDLAKLAAKNCGICKLEIKVSAKITDQCYEVSPADLGGAPIFSTAPTTHVDYVLIRATTEGNCLCAKDSYDATKEVGSLFNCKGKTSEYHYEYLWDICPCDPNVPPPTPTRPKITPPPTITPPMPPPPPTTTPPEPPPPPALPVPPPPVKPPGMGSLTAPLSPLAPGASAATLPVRASFLVSAPSVYTATQNHEVALAVPPAVRSPGSHGPKTPALPPWRALPLVLWLLLAGALAGCACVQPLRQAEPVCRTYDIGALAGPVSAVAHRYNQSAVDSAMLRTESPFGLGYTYINQPLEGMDNVLDAIRQSVANKARSPVKIWRLDCRHLCVLADEAIQREAQLELHRLVSYRRLYESGSIAQEVDSTQIQEAGR